MKLSAFLTICAFSHFTVLDAFKLMEQSESKAISHLANQDVVDDLMNQGKKVAKGNGTSDCGCANCGCGCCQQCDCNGNPLPGTYGGLMKYQCSCCMESEDEDEDNLFKDFVLNYQNSNVKIGLESACPSNQQLLPNGKCGCLHPLIFRSSLGIKDKTDSITSRGKKYHQILMIESTNTMRTGAVDKWLDTLKMLKEYMKQLESKTVYGADMRISVILMGDSPAVVADFEKPSEALISSLQLQGGATPDFGAALQEAFQQAKSQQSKSSTVDFVVLAANNGASITEADVQTIDENIGTELPGQFKKFQGYSYSDTTLGSISSMESALNSNGFSSSIPFASNTYATLAADLKTDLVPSTSVVDAVDCVCPDGSVPDSEGKCQDYDYTEDDLAAKKKAENDTKAANNNIAKQ